MSAPFIVMCAPNGARKTKDDHPALPVTPAELADCAVSIADAGASMMHVHVRDDEDGHTLDVGRYRDAIAAIHGRVDDRLVIQVTTEACGIYERDEQMAMVRELRPEAVSLALKEICPDRDAESEAEAFYRWLVSERIMAQHILYSSDEVERFASLLERGVIVDEKPFVLFVLGRYAENLTGDPAELDALVSATPERVTWAVCCFGRTEHDAVRRSAGLGGHARVGFENNLILPEGGTADDNTDLLRLAVAAGKEAGRPPATADDVREWFEST